MSDVDKQSRFNRRYWLEHVRGAALVTLLIALPIAQLFLPRVGPFFGAIAILFCILAHALSSKDVRWSAPMPGGQASRALFASLIVALGWATLSLSWGLDLRQGIDALATSCLALVGGWFLAHHFALIPYERLPIVVLLGVLTGAISMLVGFAFEEEIRSVHPSNYVFADFNRIAVSLAVLMPLLILVAARGKRYAAFALPVSALATLAIATSDSESAKVGLAASAAAGLAVLVLPGLRKLITCGLAAIVVLMPFAIGPLQIIASFLPDIVYRRGNVEHRLAIWKGFADQAVENFWFGWGMRSDPTIGTLEKTQRYVEAIGLKGNITSPHNMALELWINVGLLGIIPIAVALASLGFLKISNRGAAAAQMSVVVAATLIFLTGSSGFQGWLLSAYATAGAVLWAMIWRLNHIEARHVL